MPAHFLQTWFFVWLARLANGYKRRVFHSTLHSTHHPFNHQSGTTSSKQAERRQQRTTMSTAIDNPAQPATTARDNSNPSISRSSVHTATAAEGEVRHGHHEQRQTEVQTFADVRPALLKWLNDQDDLFQLAEQTTGLQREMIFYGACALLMLFLILAPAPGAGLLCNAIGFVYPAQQSVIAIRSERKDDDTQWLVYWTTFALFSVLDNLAAQIYRVFPLYWVAKLAFLLYLALPQTLGAHTLYVKYVGPAFDSPGPLLGIAL